MAKRPEPVGIDGWLLAFLALCPMISLVYAAMLGASQIQTERIEYWLGPFPLWARIEIWTVYLAHILLPLAILWRMIRTRDWSSVQFAIATFWIMLVGIRIIDYVWTYLMSGLAKPFPAFLAYLLRDALIALGATTFLLASRRVENTYPRRGSTEEDRVRSVFL